MTRGGAALSLKAVTSASSIKFMGTGGKSWTSSEPFHPGAHGVADSRHGATSSASVELRHRSRQPEDDMKRMEEKMRKGEFTLEDFLDQLRQMAVQNSARWRT